MTATTAQLAALKKVRRSIKKSGNSNLTLEHWIDKNTDQTFGRKNGCFSNVYKLKGLPFLVKFALKTDHTTQKLYANIPEKSALAKRFLTYLLRGYISKDFKLAFAFQAVCEKTRDDFSSKENGRFNTLKDAAQEIANQEGLMSVSVSDTYCSPNFKTLADIHGGNCGINAGKLVIFDW
jgi:hypothetical protein